MHVSLLEPAHREASPPLGHANELELNLTPREVSLRLDVSLLELTKIIRDHISPFLEKALADDHASPFLDPTARPLFT